MKVKARCPRAVFTGGRLGSGKYGRVEKDGKLRERIDEMVQES